MNMTDDINATYTLFFDGCCKGNPGKGGAGFAIFKNQIEIYAESSFVGTRTTNNVAEYTALMMGLQKAVELKLPSLIVKGDSMLAIKQMNGQFKVSSPSLIPLFTASKQLEKVIGRVQYEHVYREFNKRADQLANEGLHLQS
jgi:ribonuclease HI